MSFKGISFIIFALIAPALLTAEDGGSWFKIDTKIEGIEVSTTAPAATAGTPSPTSMPPANSLTEYTTWESLEWMAADCQMIVRATVLDSQTSDRTVAKIRVDESIKGDVKPGAVLTIELPRALTNPAQYNDVWRGDMAIFFLKENKDANSKYPLRPRWSQATFNLSRTGYTFALLMDCTPLRDPQKILAEVRAAARFNVDPQMKPVSVAYSTPSGSGCLVLPPDDRTKKLARNWIESKRTDFRVLGVRALHDFKSDQSIALARRLLYDTQTSSPLRLGKWQMGFFPVRVEAQNLLNDWNIPHEQVPEIGPVYVYRQITLSLGLLIWPAMVTVLFVILKLLRRRGYRILVALIASLLCIAAIGSISWVWVRSKTIVDEVMFSSSTAHHEIASYHGGVQYQLMREWTIHWPLVFGSFDLQQHDDVWSASALSPLVTNQMAGFMSGHGHLAGPAGAIHPYSLCRVPYWVLIVPFGLTLLRQAHLLTRQFRRRRLGLCQNCGYDLRENQNGKCPECGAGVDSARLNKTREKIPVGDHSIGM